LFVDQGAPGTTLPGSNPGGTALDSANYDSGEVISRSVMEYVYLHSPELKKRGYHADDLLSDVTASVSTTAPTITLTATAPNANDAVLMANAVATGFEQYKTDQALAALKLSQDNLKTQISNEQVQKNKDQSVMANNPSTSTNYLFANNDLQLVNQRINALEQSLNQLPVTVKGDVVVIQKAKPADVSSSSKSGLIIGAAAGVGLVHGALIMMLIIFLDNRLRGEDRVKEKLGMAYLGGLFNNKDIKENPTRAAGVAMQQFTDICVNLRLTGILPGEWRAPKGSVLLVTSPQVAEGKTTVAAGVAASMARSGGTVVVIDGNLKNPSTHLAFGMGVAGIGLSGLLKSMGHETADDVVQRSNVPGVWLLPAGPAMEDSALLMEQKLPDILSQLRKKADLVVIDGPALLSGSEASLIATMVDGVAMIVDFRHDKVGLLMRAREIVTSLTHARAGIVLNRLPRRRRNSYFATALPGSTATEQWVSVPTRAGNGHSNGKSDTSSGQKPEPAIASSVVAAAPISVVPPTPSVIPMTPNRQGPGVIPPDSMLMSADAPIKQSTPPPPSPSGRPTSPGRRGRP